MINIIVKGNFIKKKVKSNNVDYDGGGEFHDEHNVIYIGQFKNGNKNGYSYIFKNDTLIKEWILIDEEKLNIEKNENNDYDNNDDERRK